MDLPPVPTRMSRNSLEATLRQKHTIVTGEVTTLEHELSELVRQVRYFKRDLYDSMTNPWNDPVEAASRKSKPVLASCQLAEILCCLGDNLVKELEGYPTSGF